MEYWSIGVGALAIRLLRESPHLDREPEGWHLYPTLLLQSSPIQPVARLQERGYSATIFALSCAHRTEKNHNRRARNSRQASLKVQRAYTPSSAAERTEATTVYQKFPGCAALRTIPGNNLEPQISPRINAMMTRQSIAAAITSRTNPAMNAHTGLIFGEESLYIRDYRVEVPQQETFRTSLAGERPEFSTLTRFQKS